MTLPAHANFDIYREPETDEQTNAHARECIQSHTVFPCTTMQLNGSSYPIASIHKNEGAFTLDIHSCMYSKTCTHFADNNTVKLPAVIMLMILLYKTSSKLAQKYHLLSVHVGRRH